MKSILTAIALFTPLAASAHDGLHHHPHGVEGLWLGLAAIAVAGLLLFVRNR